jgi:hypothetical protein
MSEKLSLGPHDSLEIRSSTPEALEGTMRVRVDGEERELATGAEIEIGAARCTRCGTPEPSRPGCAG